MTAQPLTAVGHPLDRDQRTAILLTVALALGALVLGYSLRLAVESATTSLSQGGVSADLPAGWLVTRGVGDGAPSAFSAFDPRSPTTAFSASIVPGTDAEAAARGQLAQDHALRDGFTELDAFPVRLEGREGYRIDYAFVESGGNDALPVVLRAVALFLVDGEEVVGLTYVSRADEFANRLEQFFRFASSAGASP